MRRLGPPPAVLRRYFICALSVPSVRMLTGSVLLSVHRRLVPNQTTGMHPGKLQLRMTSFVYERNIARLRACGLHLAFRQFDNRSSFSQISAADRRRNSIATVCACLFAWRYSLRLWQCACDLAMVTTYNYNSTSIRRTFDAHSMYRSASPGLPHTHR